MENGSKEILKQFEEHITTETRKAGDSAERLLDSIVSEHIQHTRGKEVWEEFKERQEEEVEFEFEFEPLTADTLMYSLIDQIPLGADPIVKPVVEFNGLAFTLPLDEDERKLMERNNFYMPRRIIAPYVANVRDCLKMILQPQAMDIKKEMERSEHLLEELRKITDPKKITIDERLLEFDIRFRGLLPEEINIKQLKQLSLEGKLKTFFGKILETEDEETLNQIIDNPNPKPLFEITTSKDLCKEWGIDARTLLNAVFDEEEEDLLGNSDHVLLHDIGIFYLADGEIRFLQANDKYKNLFFTKRDKNEIKDPYYKPTSDAKTKLQTKLSAIVHKTVQEKLEVLPLSAFEGFREALKKRFNLNLTGFDGRLRYLPEIREEKYQQLLIKLLERLKDVLPHFFGSLNITKQRRSNLDLDDKNDVAIRLKTLSQELYRPKALASFIRGDPAFNLITIQDLELLEKYPEYEKVIYFFVLANIFQRIHEGKEGVHQESYEEFKELLGTPQIEKERHALQSRGFKKNDPLTEYAVLINYFIYLGVEFMVEHVSKAPSKLPDKFRNYFKKHIIKERDQLTEGNANEKALVKKDPPAEN